MVAARIFSIGALLAVAQAKPASKSAAAVPTCRAGFEYDGTTCVRSVMADMLMKCPEGFQLETSSSSSGKKGGDAKCVDDMTQPPTLLCPEGYTYENDVCSREEAVNPDTSCPPGFAPVGNTCQQEVETPGSFVCPPGYEFNQAANTCERANLIPPTLHCPVGFRQFEGNQCIKEETVAPSMVCPKDYQMSGKQCVKAEEAPPKAFCPDGTQAPANGQCPVTSAQPVNPDCPPGYDYDAKTNTCRAPGILSSELVCPPGFTRRELNGEIKCVQEEEPWCPEGYIFDRAQGVCVRTVAPWCPPGFTFYPPESKCLRAVDVVTVEKVGPERVTVLDEAPCPPGTTQSGDQCLTTTLEQAILVCPDGFEGPDEQGRCIRQVTAPADSVCPKGYAQGKKGECLANRTAPPRAVCPPGYEPFGQSCRQIFTENPIFACPPNYQRDGNRCFREEVAPVLPFCPKGYQLIGGRCLRVVAAPTRMECPEGFEMDAFRQICTASRRVEPELYCPKGYALSGKGDGCVRTETAAPISAPTSDKKY
uniref:Oocyst wall protein n=1 Tax=Chromera velia CCMP2878 TaxID=1169474 RepID=A0A0G4I3J1_9ALVE|mmetsp:Transcript_6565/g.12979  ORF Transcript_6565/g.12979 Transcript_6565/m.12979 type:complete len:535 (-) Transcript_6565:755-2359(-)|eukprot:Cvel_10600.t1-p1 / transcript=Cvel_10600.t1 / gene=Cvel_10600 / organism=Chromera_velia_CCMP2878 / gene_product=Latent-transforming growth factor beta-binding, putative / transcript_product=Latent-transforming growth factor beta-binding, putative / location=Cvel_scaffold643:12336-14923(-) / protein_length=534 / sequence_SO=supercontig / SO=protein_coding / is_pseudo=false